MNTASIKTKLQHIVDAGTKAEINFKDKLESRGILESVRWFKGTSEKLFAAMYAQSALNWINDKDNVDPVDLCIKTVTDSIMVWRPEQSSSAIGNAVQHEELEAMRAVLRALQDRFL